MGNSQNYKIPSSPPKITLPMLKEKKAKTAQILAPTVYTGSPDTLERIT